ncbi:ATP-binding protein [Salmonella enterica]|nr:ATP-binding protein [Salmonella enterica]EGL7476538.1 ATP-binding protein [Salmonella enterica]EIZ2334631.1 ATP-binding protein [Salmonella enterica]
MADLFDGMKGRMDALTAERFGVKVNINGTDCIVVESDFLAELGPVEGNGKNVVVFSGNVIPRRGDRVVLRGSEFTVTRIRRFNGKPQLTLEESHGGKGA